jgi:hypothetical protein
VDQLCLDIPFDEYVERVRAHLDMSADAPDAEVARHEALGATVVHVAAPGTTLHDPAGLVYCATHRRPFIAPD